MLFLYTEATNKIVITQIYVFLLPTLFMSFEFHAPDDFKLFGFQIFSFECYSRKASWALYLISTFLFGTLVSFSSLLCGINIYVMVSPL